MSDEVKDITSLLASPTKEDVALVEKAFQYAREHHEGQKRYGGTDHIDHLTATARILADLGMGPTTIAAGLLHDVVEDTPVTEEKLKEDFGEEIAFLVDGVTKLGQVAYSGARRHRESLRKFFIASSKDIRVLMIKLCDRLHNMLELKHCPEEQRLRVAKETLDIYAPVAYRLGIRHLSRQLEDLAFPFVYPKEYEQIAGILKSYQKRGDKYLNNFKRSLHKQLAKQYPKLQVFVDYRVKGTYSFWKKLERKKGDIDKVYDIFAVRVITENVEDCYLILGVVHNIWQPLPQRVKDYISSPKPDGYQSIHTTIFAGDGSIIEVQIKTRDMHNKAEYGIMSHVSHKKKLQLNRPSPNFIWLGNLIPFRRSKQRIDDHSNTPHWIKELVEYQESIPEDADFLKDLKKDFFEERIFVFTPKGDAVDLPIDSTPIDFAFNVHTDLGIHISEAKVNGKLVALDTKLQNGDIVEIKTSEKQTAKRKWLDIVKTTSARRRIQALLSPKKVRR